MPAVTVTVQFLGICTFFLPLAHPARLNGFHRAVLVNAANGKTIAGQVIRPHRAVVQIGNGEKETMNGMHMRLHASNAEPPRRSAAAFIESCPNLTMLVARHLHLLSDPSQKVVFDGDPEAAALYFDFHGGTLTAGRNQRDAVVSTLVLGGDEVTLETSPFGETETRRTVFREDTTIHVMNVDEDDSDASPYDFYLHYLTAERIPSDPPIPNLEELRSLPLLPHLPPCYGAIGAGCSNSTYP